MKIYTSIPRYVSVLGMVYLLFVVIPASDTVATILMPNPEHELRAAGYPTATIAQIENAAKDHRCTVRFYALELLAQRAGQDAIPVLREALDDPKIDVRYRAARFLGMLGDKSGLERMRRDLAELAPTNGAPEPVDPKVAEDPKAMEDWENQRNFRLTEAVYPALVLAEQGDPAGYELASRLALEGTRVNQRERSVLVLKELTKLDDTVLRERKMDPRFVLCAVAESEKDPMVLWMVMNVDELDDEIAVDILERIEASPFASEDHHRSATRNLRRIRAKIEAEKEQGGTDKQ